MRLLLATSIKYPSPLANRMQVTNMATAFFHILGDRFFFGGRNLPTGAPKDMQLVRIEGKKRAFLFAWRYMQKVQDRKITHVYTREKNMLFFMLLYNILWFHYRGLKFIFEEHEKPSTHKMWYRFLITHVDTIITLSEPIQALIRADAPGTAVYIVVHGVDIATMDSDISKEEARARVQLGFSIPIVGYVGTFSTMGSVEKGIGLALEAFRHVLESAPDAELVLVGGSPKEIARYQAQAQAYGIDKNVRLLPRVSPEHATLYRKSFDVQVLPLLQNEYAFMLPLKVFEYMATGRPIVASDLPSVRPILNEKNSFLVAAGDAVALADGIVSVLGAYTQAEVRARHARNDVAMYTWEARAQKIISFIN